MKERQGDIWSFHDAGYYTAVTTNGIVKSDTGKAVMGKGIALDAAQRFPLLPDKLGRKLTRTGNHLYVFPEYRIITFPTKNEWWKAPR